MINLQPDLKLKRAPGIEVYLNSSTDIRISCKGNVVEIGKYALPILDVFSYAQTVSEALKILEREVAGMQDWIQLTSAITQLRRFGALVSDEESISDMSTKPYGFDSALIHALMLNDRIRTESFIAGINKVVRPNDIVIDIGTGTGILALAAARAGARHVYAIEAGGIGKTAEALFKSNSFGDRITLVSGWSTQIDLEERADVMVSEIIGNEPLDEKIIETNIDARKRLLKDDARLVPGKMRIMGLPVTIPSSELNKRTFSKEALSRWNRWYEFDFSPLQQMISDAPQSFFIKPQKAEHWVSISQPVMLAEIDFKSVKESMIDNNVQATAETTGEISGLLIYFELEIAPDVILSTHPQKADENNHWQSLIWAAPKPLFVKNGDSFNVIYKYKVPGTRDRVQIFGEARED